MESLLQSKYLQGYLSDIYEPILQEMDLRKLRRNHMLKLPDKAVLYEMGQLPVLIGYVQYIWQYFFYPFSKSTSMGFRLILIFWPHIMRLCSLSNPCTNK